MIGRLLDYMEAWWQRLNCQHYWVRRTPTYYESTHSRAHMHVFYGCVKCGEKRQEEWPWFPRNDWGDEDDNSRE